MLYSLSPQDLDFLKTFPKRGDFIGAEMLFVRFRTERHVVERMLPSGLKVPEDPHGIAFVARYPETNFHCVYGEGALFLECERRSERGLYCLAMPVDDDIAMIGGRELYGYPKKLAEAITLEADGDRVVGRVVRRGHEILRIECDLQGAATPAAAAAFGRPTVDDDGKPGFEATAFNYKYFPGPGGFFDYVPRLVRQPSVLRPRDDLRQGTATLHLGTSVRDPLGEVPVGEVVSAIYGSFDNTMYPGKVVGRAWNVFRFARHAYFKADIAACRLAGER